MTTLHVVLDEILAPSPTGRSRYATELTRALIQYAPQSCSVDGMVGSSPESDYRLLAELLPGLGGMFKSALARRDLVTAWQHGFTPVPSGMIHAPTLLAPLRNHDRVNGRRNQITVTIHSVAAWTSPELLPPREVSWTKAMALRAVKYADAVVVPSHAVAAELEGILSLGDRIRVLGGAVGSELRTPDDATERAERLQLPEAYLMTTGDPGPGFIALLDALVRLDRIDLPIVVSGGSLSAEAVSDAATTAGLPAERVIALPALGNDDRAVAIAHATAFVYPTLVSGFGTPMLEAFRFGIPVIHSDAAALVEVAGDAGFSVPSTNRDAYPGLLAEAIENVLDDDSLRRRLSVLGADREKLFTWRTPAEGIWQLQADL